MLGARHRTAAAVGDRSNNNTLTTDIIILNLTKMLLYKKYK